MQAVNYFIQKRRTIPNQTVLWNEYVFVNQTMNNKIN